MSLTFIALEINKYIVQNCMYTVQKCMCVCVYIYIKYILYFYKFIYPLVV